MNDVLGRPHKVSDAIEDLPAWLAAWEAAWTLYVPDQVKAAADALKKISDTLAAMSRRQAAERR